MCNSVFSARRTTHSLLLKECKNVQNIQRGDHAAGAARAGVEVLKKSSSKGFRREVVCLISWRRIPAGIQLAAQMAGVKSLMGKWCRSECPRAVPRKGLPVLRSLAELPPRSKSAAQPIAGAWMLCPDSATVSGAADPNSRKSIARTAPESSKRQFRRFSPADPVQYSSSVCIFIKIAPAKFFPNSTAEYTTEYALCQMKKTRQR